MIKNHILYLFGCTTLLVACGGGAGALVAAFSYIAPIGGLFKSLDPTPVTLSFTFPQTLATIQTGTATTSLPVPIGCPAAPATDFEVVVDGVTFNAYADASKAKLCFSGTFAGVHKITLNSTNAANAPVTVNLYREPDAHLRLSENVWVDTKNTKNRFKFKDLTGRTLLAGCEVVNDVNLQGGIATNLWTYNTPFDALTGDKQPVLPHLVALADTRTASFISYNLIGVFQNNQLIAEYQRVAEVAGNAVTCN